MLKISAGNVKLFTPEDAVPFNKAQCLKNESFSFQVCVIAEPCVTLALKLKTDLPCNAYLVHKLKGDFYLDKPRDDYFVRRVDNMYPDLLRRVDHAVTDENGFAVVYVEIPACKKRAGKHAIEVCVGEETAEVELTVLDAVLQETNLILTNWFHCDAICDYYGVEVWSEAFYRRFEDFLSAYVKMGNNTILTPVFTPPLDTQVGGERTTVQLVKVKKSGEKYDFDFSEHNRFIDLCLKHGIKYFEFSHLFTQWGGEFCPKIIVEENGKEYNAFGWDVRSDDERYRSFLSAYLQAFVPYVKSKGILHNSFMHLTDEPTEVVLERYTELSAFVKARNGGIPILDALSHFDFMEKKLVDLPAVATSSKDLAAFDAVDNMLYYCVGVDDDYLSNRYFDMPLQRTEILGFQLYETGTKGFLHWGFNFYNSQFSIRKLNPYEETTAGGGFCAGDSFVVYPGKDEVEYSLRYFSMLKAFEDYRLAKTAEKKIGREKVLAFLHEEGIFGVHRYPKDAAKHTEIRNKLYAIICS